MSCVHKFIRHRRERLPRNINHIEWKPSPSLKYPPEKMTPATWLVYCQEKLTIKPQSTKTISLGLGVEMSSGSVIASLKQNLRLLNCSLQNGTLVESVSDIVITVQNNSSADLVIVPGQELCYVHYTK